MTKHDPLSDFGLCHKTNVPKLKEENALKFLIDRIWLLSSYQFILAQ